MVEPGVASVRDPGRVAVNKVISTDGTPIAFERYGQGPPVILVGGALCDRASHRPLAERLAEGFTAITYDRRGRGDSGDTPPYEVQREIEDVSALVTAAGGSAALYGHSSGAALALRAAASDLPVTKIVLHEPPYNQDDDEQRQISRQYAEELERILADGRSDDAVAHFMTTVGMPPEAVAQSRTEPWWHGMVGMAPTLAYESAVMGDRDGGTVPSGLLGRVTAPALVLCGGASPDWMVDVGRHIADGLSEGHHKVLDGEDHVVAPEVLVPVLARFLAE